MLTRYVVRDFVRNPRRTLATLVGVFLGIGHLSAVLFFIDGSAAAMTQRAVSPLPIDVQRVLTRPGSQGLGLTESFDRRGPVAPGGAITVHLELVNTTDAPANEVVLRSALPNRVRYLSQSTLRDHTSVADVVDGSPLAQGAGQAGLNLGTLPPGVAVSIEYRVQAVVLMPAPASAGFRSSFSTRENVVPVLANADSLVGLHDLATRISALPGVAHSDELSFVDLPSGSLTARSSRAAGTVRLFGFGAGYSQRHDDIRILTGSQEPGRAMISAEAAKSLAVRVGDVVSVMLPSASQPTTLTVSGIVDLSRARSLFSSRQGANLEEFVYSPFSIVISPVGFTRSVLPAYELATTARGEALKSVPILEVDIGIERSRLAADPRTALGQTTAIARRIREIAPGQDYLIDNISNTLRVAADDATTAKSMFVFLGVPGGLLAAILAGYAGAVLADAQRREQATLRTRGANRGHLLRMLALKTLLLTAVGSVVGVSIGLLAAWAVLGSAALSAASTTSLAVSGLVGVGSGFVATGAALYLAGRRSITREISEDRVRLAQRAPLWRRARLDLLGALLVIFLTALASRSDAFAGNPGSVYNGRSVKLDLSLLALPLGAWLAGTLIAARVAVRVVTHPPPTDRPPFAHLAGGLLRRSVGRRPWACAEAMTVTALIVALGTSIASFISSYDHAKVADSRFIVGSDIRITPAPGGAPRLGIADAASLISPSLTGATPVTYRVQNSVLRSNRNEDAANVAGIDPTSFLAVAALDNHHFVGTTAPRVLGQLARDPDGVLLSTEMADYLTVSVGQPVQVLIGKDTDHQTMADMHVIGLFERLPGFPSGVQAAINLHREAHLDPAVVPDFFLARTTDARHGTLASAVHELRTGPGLLQPIRIDTRETALDKDQSSLAALNIHGLLALDSAFALALGTAATAIFVFGLMLQRRREYLTLRAQGLHPREIRTLIVAEACGVAIGGCVAGLVVGIWMAYYFVRVLRPLFVLAPSFELPALGIATLPLLVVASAVVTSVVATSVIHRLEPTELLRDE